jgi:hypothetical protein
MPLTYATPLLYPSVPATQQPIVKDGKIVAWIVKISMTLNGIVHSATEYYESAEDEILPEETHDAGPLLEKILLKMDLERDLNNRCARELEQKAYNLNRATGVSK